MELNKLGAFLKLPKERELLMELGAGLLSVLSGEQFYKAVLS